MSAAAGTPALVRLALRRDRIMIPAWVLVTFVLIAGSARATTDLYATVGQRVRFVATSNGTPAIVALYGRIPDARSPGSVALFKIDIIGAVLAAVLSILLVVRHTRAEEESGRLELVGATGVGRRAPLTAALLVAGGADLALGLLSAAGLVAVGLPVEGSLVAGTAFATVGFAFAAIAAVVAQLTSSGRAAVGLSSAVLVAVYVVRAAGDSADAGGARRLTWLSPLGWGRQFRPYAGDRWWVALVTLGFAAVMVAAAYVLVARRDLGAGLLPDRPGPPRAGRALAGPLGLAWRLQRTSLLWWTVAFAILGAVLGGMAGSVSDIVGDSAGAGDLITKLGGGEALTDAFLSTELSFLGIGAAVFGVQTAMRARGEETAGAAELVLAASVGRFRWLASWLAVALAGTALLMAVAGVASGLVYAGQSGDGGETGRLAGAALARVPAVWVSVGVVAAAFGLLPRLAAAGWAALALFLVLTEGGPLLGLPQGVQDVSPFTHVPHLPGGQASAAPFGWLFAVAVVLLAAGLAGFRRRDLTS
ncbi:ABC transporter permease [Actinomadura parmotrematis]|uniref:ABC transporter permease n=1 Tax=Actinomadura parmotrematis TaxID=2864039 RepID=A0ABS7G1S3_9ACTN|nr:ABC transporter permease [Actinomadura parmotrematis]MBW8486165.1 ABC transporter permease [Actinomadura parmotrematis]